MVVVVDDDDDGFGVGMDGPGRAGPLFFSSFLFLILFLSFLLRICYSGEIIKKGRTSGTINYVLNSR